MLPSQYIDISYILLYTVNKGYHERVLHMKKTLVVLLSALLLFPLFTGCAEDDPYANFPETPVEMFEYEENEDGGITITKYIGEDPEVKIPENINDKTVTTIGLYAFNHNPSLATVIMPDTIICIDNGAFVGCELLTVVDLSKNLMRIGHTAFKECKALETIVLPETLTEIGGYAFAECSTLSTISLPNALTTLESGAFQKCSALKHISIPENITVIDEEVFMESGLEAVELPNGLTQIKAYAFYDTNLSEIVVPDGVKEMEFHAFAGCEHLESVKLGDGLVEIGGMAFAGDSKLTEIVIPKMVTTVVDDSFSYCTALEAVKFEGDAPEDFRFVMEGYTSDGKPAFLTAQDVHFTVYYHEGAKGFTSPEWEGYPTEIW